jgi:hypothetical protein
VELNFKIYALYDENKPKEIRYIGRTKNSIEKRLYFHIKGVKYDKGYKSNWIKSVLEKGGKIKTKLLLEGLTEEEGAQKEIEFIAQYKKEGYKLTNGTNGGDGLSMPTQETIEKIRKSQTGKISKLKGRKLEDIVGQERAAVMNIQNSQRQLGKKLTSEHKKNIKKNSAKIWLGKKLPKEMIDKSKTNRKIAVATEEFHKRRSILSSKPIVQLNNNGIFIQEWPNIKSASEFIGINRSGIGECCSGKRKSAGGYKWSYK